MTAAPKGLPYPNSIAARLADAERRIQEIEDLRPDVIADRVERLRNEIRDLKRATYAAIVLLIAVLGVLVPILTK